MNRAPWMRIQEDIVCRAYYKRTFPHEFENPHDPIPEDRCKVADVQGKLAKLRGWDQTFSCLPSIITAVPYGVMADKYGRKIVMFLSLLGIIMSLVWQVNIAYFSQYIPIEWYWAGNVFLFIGGGSAVVKSMCFTILADVASEESPLFFGFNAVYLIGGVFAVPASWYLMKQGVNPFVPMTVSIGFITLGLLVVVFIPETLNRTQVPDPAEGMSSSDIDSEDEGGLLSASKKPTFISVMVRKVEEVRFIFASPMLLALTITFLVQSMHAVSMQLLFQFASERFHWSLADSSFLIPLSSIANFFILVVAFPAIYSLLTSQFGLSAAAKDLIVSRGSVFFSIFGALFIAVSPIPSLLIIAIIIYSFGNGFTSSARSLITSLVRPDQVSRLYAVLATLDVIGTIISGPLLSGAYSWGLHIGGLWSGMAFIVLAVLFSVTCLPIFFFKLPEIEVEED
ncbi:MFS efflux pump [Hyphodiscus hymeniophilus]|uniref:MFS efflux pump n=1 Tax=Hyphodiscus hymeniophilus TaxID=353542 RepID=A0A9P6SQ25_9HELO|nr:MFS efflux pump [Hyphodiscus hymeniophilus]